MLPGQPSRTLLVPAIARAAHQLVDSPPLLLEDPLAVGLVPETAQETILAKPDEHRTEAARLLRALFALRNRFAEDRLELAVKRGVRQYVMLGAGIETFPWRQPGFAGGLRIFFSDHPVTLAWAQQRFCDRKLPIPSNLIFAPSDLEQGSVRRDLIEVGLSTGLPTFVSMLGVSQYLTGDTIDTLIAFFASLPAGSEAVFSFTVPDEELSGLDLAEIRAGISLGNLVGERWFTRERPDQMLARVRRFRFRDIFHLDPAGAQQRYFAGRIDGLAAPHREQLIAAVV